MNAWLQLALTLAGVGGLVIGLGRWLMRGIGTRVTEVVRAETGPQFAELRTQVDTQFAEVRTELVDLRHQSELTNQRLSALEGDMTLVKQRLLSAS